MHKNMFRLVAGIIVSLLAVLGGWYVLDDSEAPVAEVAAEPQWLEQIQDAASFASDWLSDLDNGEYDLAAVSYKFEGNEAENRQELESARGALGAMSSRLYVGAQVFAVATDDSEHQVRVVYESEFAKKTVTETVDVLLWPNKPVILRYLIEVK